MSIKPVFFNREMVKVIISCGSWNLNSVINRLTGRTRN